MKILKTFLKIIGILIIVLVIAVIAIPTLFRGKIESTAKDLINKNVNAKVDFKNLSISLIRDFPNARVSLEDLVIVGVDKFDGDTLASLLSFSTSVSLFSLIKGDFNIKSIIVDKPNIQARVLADGSANWDIMKADSTAVQSQPESAAETSSDFKLSLKKVQINQANIVFDDEQAKMLAGVKNMNLNLRGDFSSAQTTINLSANTEAISVYENNSALVSNLALAFDGEVDANLADGIYTLKENEIKANGMALQANGTAKTIANGMDLDLTYGLKVPSLKSLLALIPPSIVQEVKDIDTKGDLSMSGAVKGIYNEKSMPVITLALNVKNGYAKYSGFDEAISNINVDLDMLLDKNKDANSRINLSQFGFTVAGNPFAMSGKVTTPFTDANMAIDAKGKIDFTSLRKCLPLTDAALAGMLNANINFVGTMSQIENAQYDKIKLAGDLELNSFKMKMEGFEPEITMDKASVTFTPSYCALNSFDAKMGSSDLHMNGRLENVLPYIFKGSAMKGNLTLKSALINCNELMGGSETPADATDQTAPVQVTNGGVIVLPSNVNFNINANVDKLVYDNLTMNNAVGQVTLAKGKLDLSKLAMNALNGSMNLGGWYYAADTTKADVNMKFTLNNVDVADAAKTFDIFGKFAPIMKEMKGKMNISLDFATAMNGNMDIDYKTLNATGTLKTESLEFLSSESIAKLSELLKTDKIKSVKNLNMNFTIKNGMLDVNPFDVKLGNYAMKIGGQQGIDGDLNYDADVVVPAGNVGAELNKSLSKLGLGAAGNNVTVGLKIGGTMKAPTFKLGLPKYTSGGGIAGAAVSNIKETATTVVDSVKTVAKEKVNVAIDSAKNKVKEQIGNKLKDLLKR